MQRLRPCTIFVSFAIATLAIADPNSGSAVTEPATSKQRPRMDVRAVLEKGLTSGSLPEGMVIRLRACLGKLDAKGTADGLPSSMHEWWEFTSGQIRRIANANDTSGTSELAETRPFESKGLCKDLLDGKVVQTAAEAGEGPKVGFVGSRYQRGTRSIELLWNDETILQLMETNGPALRFYRESNARAFGVLYEHLADQARATFKSKLDDAK